MFMKTNGKTFASGIMILAMTTLLLKCKKADESAQAGTPVPKEETEVAASAAAITSFVHPGILNTQASLDKIGAETNGGDAVRLAAYQKVLDYINGNALPTKFWETV